MLKFSPTTMITLAFLLVFTSCGKDEAQTAQPAQDSTVNFLNLLGGLDEKYINGQFKDISQHRYHKTETGLWCDYWETVRYEVMYVIDNDLRLRTNISTHPWPENESACPKVTGDEGEFTESFNISEMQKSNKEFIRYYTDNNYRCAEMKNCTSSKFLSRQAKFLNGKSYTQIKTQYTFSTGEEYVLEASVSTKNIFEGIVEYKMTNLSDGKWVINRFLNYSN